MAIDKKIASDPAQSFRTPEELKQSKIEYQKLKEKIANYKNPTKNNVVELYYSIQNIDSTITIDLNLKYYSSQLITYQCKKPKCKQFLQKRISKTVTNKNIDEIIKQTEDEEKAKEVLKSCEYLWHQKEFQKVKENRKQEFIKSIPEILQNLKNNFTSKFSKETSKSLEKYFDNLKYVVADDPTPNEPDFDLLEFLKEEVSKAIKPKDDNTSNNYLEPPKGVLSDYQNVKRHSFMGEIKFNHLLSYCEGSNIPAVDHFNPAENDEDTFVRISSFSCNHYTSGKQVFVHELGHTISNQFYYNKSSKPSTEKYKTYRDCVTGHYLDKQFASKPIIGYFSHKNDSKYTEEDMADFIQNIVFNNPNENLNSCKFIAEDKKQC